jgi:hypothetical protein
MSRVILFRGLRTLKYTQHYSIIKPEINLNIFIISVPVLQLQRLMLFRELISDFCRKYMQLTNGSDSIIQSSLLLQQVVYTAITLV